VHGSLVRLDPRLSTSVVAKSVWHDRGREDDGLHGPGRVGGFAPSRIFGAVDLVAKPLDVKTWPTRPVSGLAAGLSWAGRREPSAAGGCSRILVG